MDIFKTCNLVHFFFDMYLTLVFENICSTLQSTWPIIHPHMPACRLPLEEAPLHRRLGDLPAERHRPRNPTSCLYRETMNTSTAQQQRTERGGGIRPRMALLYMLPSTISSHRGLPLGRGGRRRTDQSMQRSVSKATH